MGEGVKTVYNRLEEVTNQHKMDHLHRRDIDWLIEQAGKVELLERALDRVGFYCAGSEFSNVSDFILRVKSGKEKFL